MNTLIAKVIGEADITLGAPGKGPVAGINQADVDRVLRVIHDRFVDERTRGFINPETHQQMPPISPEEAEQRWQRKVQHFTQLLNAVEPESEQAQRLDIRSVRGEGPARYTHPEAQ